MYEAVHTATAKEILVEILDSALVDRQVVEEDFLRSMRKISRLRHRSMVPIDGFGVTTDGDLYVAVEHRSSPRLSELVDERGPLPWEHCRELLSSIKDALGAAHRRSIPHGGLRPEVVFVAPRSGSKDVVELYDFGMHDVAVAARFAANTRGATTQLVGDPRYLALEQFVSGKASIIADIYALGAVLYYMLTGRPPCSGVNAFQALTRNQEGRIVPPREIEASIPSEVEAIVMRSLAREPSDRFGDLAEFDRAVGLAPTREVVMVLSGESDPVDHRRARSMGVGEARPMVAPPERPPSRPEVAGPRACAVPMVPIIGATASSEPKDWEAEATAMFVREPAPMSPSESEGTVVLGRPPIHAPSHGETQTEILTGAHARAALQTPDALAVDAPSGAETPEATEILASVPGAMQYTGPTPSLVGPPVIVPREAPRAAHVATSDAWPPVHGVAPSASLIGEEHRAVGHVVPVSIEVSLRALILMTVVVIILGVVVGIMLARSTASAPAGDSRSTHTNIQEQPGEG